MASPDGDEIRSLLAAGRPHRPEAVGRVIEIVRAGGHVDRTLAEVHDRIAAARAAMAALGDGRVTKVFRGLADYLTERVDAALDH